MARILDGSWIDHFLYYTKASESPDSYLKWAAMSAVAGATQRRVWTKWIYYDIYPNMYVVLVGPPGKTHKSSTIWHVENLLRNIGAPVSSQSLSREGLIKQMIERGDIGISALTALPDEFSDLIKVSKDTMIEFLTTIYNCPDQWEYTTRHRPTEKVEKAFLNMLGGTTPRWMGSEFDMDFVDGGFAARTLWIREDEPRFRKAFPPVTDDMLNTFDKLVDDLAHISEIRGRFEWTQGAHDWFKEWYEYKLPKQTIDYRLDSYLARKPLHLLKTTMILSLAERDELVMDKEMMIRALGELDEIEDKIVHAFTSVGRNIYASDSERIYHDILAAGVIPESEIRRRNEHALTKLELDEILENLVLMKKVKKEAKGGDWIYNPRR